MDRDDTETETDQDPPAHIQCPVCDELQRAEDFFAHIFYEHPTFFVVLSQYGMPEPVYLPQLEVPWSLHPEEDEELPYEVLLDICETIGDHHVGVENMDHVAPLLSGPSEWMQGRCPICLDVFKESDTRPLRKTWLCNHVFCDDCIKPWLEKHKTCPLCKQDLTEIPAQMASISMEPVSEAEPSSSSSERDRPANDPVRSPSSSSS